MLSGGSPFYSCRPTVMTTFDRVTHVERVVFLRGSCTPPSQESGTTASLKFFGISTDARKPDRRETE